MAQVQGGAEGASYSGVSTYTVKRGDTVWEIVEQYKKQISGATMWDKCETIRKLNNLPYDYTIGVDDKLKISGSPTPAKDTPSKPETPTPFTVGKLALRSDSESGRDVFITWGQYSSVDGKNKTAGYTCRWEQYDPELKKWLRDEKDIAHPEDGYCYSELTSDKKITKVRVQVRPYYDKKKYWNYVEWSKVQTYEFADNPPLPPPTPKVEIDELTLTAYIENFDPTKYDAKYVRFNVVKNNKSSIFTSEKVTINTTTNFVSWQYDDLDYGANYRVRCKCVSAKEKESGWSDFSENSGTRPSSPSILPNGYRVNKQSDGSMRAYLTWTKVESADEYVVEYATKESDFDLAPDNVTRTQPTKNTEIEIVGLEPGNDYFFRVIAKRTEGGESPPSDYVSLTIGEPPDPPTTSSSSKSAFAGEPMELNWVHNTKDGSEQTAAELALKIGTRNWVIFSFANETNSTSGEERIVNDFTYGSAISYKGTLYVELNTSHRDLKNSTILWKVRTAGITGAVSDSGWSTERTIYIYEKPTMALSVTNDISGDSAIQTLTAFPFYVRAEVELDKAAYDVQHPIGYHLQVIANDSYETVDDAGRTKLVSVGDAVYSKYFDTEEILIVEMSPDNIDLETMMRYTVRCSVNMSTGLTIEQTHDFDVSWTDAGYFINAVVSIDDTAYTAVIVPYCEDADGNLVENVSISIYRREYNGSLTKIASGIPNNGTAVTDLHPALDYARYRLIAKDDITGAISYYDMPGQRIGCTSVIIQWDEAWSLFETADTFSVEPPSHSGSILVLPYNVKISDSRKRETARVAYAGREYPVAYYGTMIDEGSSWTTTIPKSDLDTVYALRRLSLWPGPVYIREPSGMGFWAIVTPTFNVDYDAVTIPVTLDVSRVEGGA